MPLKKISFPPLLCEDGSSGDQSWCHGELFKVSNASLKLPWRHSWSGELSSCQVELEPSGNYVVISGVSRKSSTPETNWSSSTTKGTPELLCSVLILKTLQSCRKHKLDAWKHQVSLLLVAILSYSRGFEDSSELNLPTPAPRDQETLQSHCGTANLKIISASDETKQKKGSKEKQKVSTGSEQTNP